MNLGTTTSFRLGIGGAFTGFTDVSCVSGCRGTEYWSCSSCFCTINPNTTTCNQSGTTTGLSTEAEDFIASIAAMLGISAVIFKLVVWTALTLGVYVGMVMLTKQSPNAPLIGMISMFLIFVLGMPLGFIPIEIGITVSVIVFIIGGIVFGSQIRGAIGGK